LPDDVIEETAALENEAIEAMSTLVVEHGYDEDDLMNLVNAALAA
jgi:hypothetical protein